MTERSSAYELAGHIFSTVWCENGLITESDLPEGFGVLKPALGHMTSAEQVVAFGDHGNTDQPIRETLTRAKNGRYYFQATEPYGYTGDDNQLRRIVITANSPEAHMFRLLESKLVSDLFHVAVAASYPERSEYPRREQ